VTTTDNTNKLDLNEAGEQRSFDLIPAGTVCPVQISVRPGAVGVSWLRKSKDGSSEGLDLEFVVIGGPYVKRKFWTLLTVQGTTEGHAKAREISLKTLKAIVESARGIRPDDKSDTAKAARIVAWQDFDGMRFIVRVGVRAAEGQYAAKNTLHEVVTPDQKDWTQPEQLSRDLFTGANSTGPEPQAKPQPANAIARPAWAG
jgi:hypothetical protein